MAEMIQRRITLTREEDEQLRRQARARGVSAEELIREAVRWVLGERVPELSEQHRGEARREWEQIMALMRGRARLAQSPAEPAKDRGWTREDIYGGRFDHLAR